MKFLVNPDYLSSNMECPRFICGNYDCSILYCTKYSDVEPCVFTAPCPPVSEINSNDTFI